MICAIRIHGQVGVRKDMKETLDRLRIRKKYACVVLMKPSETYLGMIKKVDKYIAYGEINKETFEKLIEKRGQAIDKNKKLQSAKEIVEGLEKGKKYEDFNLKPFFRLHPPRGGIKSKIMFPKGVLGNHKSEINKLVERML